MSFARSMIVVAMLAFSLTVNACSDLVPLSPSVAAKTPTASPTSSGQAAGVASSPAVQKAAPAPSAPAQPGRQTAAIYISPTGDDAAAGTSPAKAVRTIARAQEVLKALDVRSGSQVSIRYLPGRHFNQSVDWDYAREGVTVAIEPDDTVPSSATIDGSLNPGRNSYFLRLGYAGEGTVRTGLTVRGLTVENYCEGISLGDWKTQGVTSGTTIDGNWFNRIGSAYQAAGPGAKPDGNCVAGIRLQRAVGNTISNNRFTHIVNIDSRATLAAKYGPGLLHAIYISSQSSDNLVKGNSFSQFTGSPVRIRDRSNNIIVSQNSFSDPIYASVRSKRVLYAISQWYCNEGSPACLTKAERGHLECPSENIQMTDNKLAGRLELYADESQSKRSTCNLTPER
jgi:hypothetical protein